LAKAGAQFSDEALEQLAQTLRLGKHHDPIDPQRVLELAQRLAGFAVALDNLTWELWKTVSPKSSIRRTEPLHRTLGRFAVGEVDVPLSANLERLRGLTAALLSAVNMIGRDFARDHLRPLMPSEIEASVGIEGKGMFSSKEARCWQKFQKLAEEALDEAQVERRISQIVADFAERMANRGRTR
jgi:hypothetical protein